MIVLIDMDGPLAQFEEGFLKAWQSAYPERSFIPLNERTTFNVSAQYPEEYYQDVVATYAKPGFVLNLEPVPGCIEAVRRLAAVHQVFICTTPLEQYQHCAPEKFAWVEKHLGPEFVPRTILTWDKTVVSGDILIDDKMEIKGAAEPQWVQLLFDAPYNKTTPGLRHFNWSQVAELL